AILISERFLDQPSDPLRWHAAMVWTVVAIGSLALWSAMFRRSWRFWLFLCAALAAHVSAMWYLFGVLLPKALIGTFWVSGLGLVEGFFLYILFLWLARPGTSADRVRGRSPGRDRTRPLIDRHPPMWEFNYGSGFGSARPAALP